MISTIEKILTKYRLAILIPLLTLTSGIITNAVLLFSDLRVNLSFFQNNYLNDAKIIYNNIHQQVEHLSEKEDIEGISKVIKPYLAYEMIERIDVVNNYGVLVASTHNEDIDQKIEIERTLRGCRIIKEHNRIFCNNLILVNNVEAGYLRVIFNYQFLNSSVFGFLVQRYLIQIIIVMGASFLLMFLLERFITKNVRDISAHLDKVVQGKYQETIKIEGNNEFSLIGEKINKTSKRLWELINIDYLTRIPNRFFLVKNFDDLIERSEKSLFMGLIDIDNFKEINDFFGHNAGDILLMEFAERLKQYSERKGIVYGRLGGDEFIVFGFFENHLKLNETLEEVKREVEGIYSLINSEIKISVSIGVTVVSKNDSFYDAMKRCDIVLYRAKDMGKGKIVLYTPDLAKNEIRQREILNYITTAIEKSELYLVYQPIINTKTGEIHSYEALLRWQNPNLGNVPPSEFIPFIEKTSLIVEVGKFVIKEAISAVNKLGKSMHINISLVQLYEPDFVNFIKEECSKHGVKPKNIIIELIETQELFKHSTILQKIYELKYAGFEISLDDFGTGFSNIELLDRIDPDSIKVDMILTRDVVNDIAKRHIIMSIVKMAEVLAINVIAEGVDSKEKIEVLKELGIHMMQGYYFGRPQKLEYYLDRVINA